MFTSFHIKNFRGFRDFTIDGLERVNLIAGANNVGKTALLEAIFLHLGSHNPELSLRITAWRGIKQFRTTEMDEIWGTLFHEQRNDTPIVLTGVTEEHERQTLQIQLTEPGSYPIPELDEQSNGSSSKFTTDSPLELRFVLENEGKEPLTTRAFLAGNEVRIEAHPNPHTAPISFLATHERHFQEDAERFRDLAIENREAELLPALKILEPRLRQLKALPFGGKSIIHGDTGGKRNLPLPLMGEGLGRFLTILLRLNTSENGVLLIDEIENGLHHSVMQKVWAAIGHAARQYNVQVFATTHSWECITAAHAAFSQTPSYDFRLHRLDRVDGDIEAVTLDQEMLDAAIQVGLEVR
jgi:AAA15 family ATPase/GTPase